MAAIALALAAVAALAVFAGLALARSGEDAAPTPAVQAERAVGRTDGFAGGVLDNPRRAPELVLRDYSGARIDLAADRGRPALVTFLYTNCPDVCPITVTTFRRVQGLLGPDAPRLRIVAVSVDPAGDTPVTVRRFLRQRGMDGRMRYAVGDDAELRPTWERWGVTAQADAANPGFVAHSSMIYGVAASGRLLTVYPWDAPASMIAADVLLLAER